ncbi:MAG: TetR/AcrR family transcriptional regulator [Pseudomonadota bacterium]
MAGQTREQLLDVAERLFAERGFYGASIAAIADELGLTKQALLHHYGSKEKLYGAVLQRISEYVEEHLVSTVTSSSDTFQQLEAYLLTMATSSLESPARSQLLMRELLDNKRRADTVGTWYLRSYLDTLVELVRKIPGWTDAPQEDIFITLYQLLGAINYFVVSQPTLQGIYGQKSVHQFRLAFAAQFSRILRSSLQV